MTLAEGNNPYFGNDSAIHSHRSEIYSILTALLFLDTYKKFYSIEITNPIKCYIDNLEVVNKLKQIKDTPNVFDSLWKTTDHKAVRLLKHYIHPQIIFLHVKSHQYNNKRVEDLPLEIRLNKQVDDLVTEHFCKPIQIHIFNTQYLSISITSTSRIYTSRLYDHIAARLMQHPT